MALKLPAGLVIWKKPLKNVRAIAVRAGNGPRRKSMPVPEANAVVGACLDAFTTVLAVLYIYNLRRLI
jgi:hypothetical protein